MNITQTTYELYLKVSESYTKSEISKKINVNKNTITRWELLKSVPKHYHIDLLNLIGEEIDYSIFTDKEKDQFFTDKKTAIKCIQILKEKLNELGVNYEDYTFIEPSAGDGSFLTELPINKRIGIDIEPRNNEIIKGDFLKWDVPIEGKYITIGNPPFGLRGNLALRFINHSSKFSEFTAFILPQIFESKGKGNCMDRVNNMNLIHSERVESDFYYPNGENVRVNVIFQIWSKFFKTGVDNKTASDFIKIYSVSNGGTSSTTRNKKMWYNCDLYLPTTCFEDKMKIYTNFDDLPQKRGYGIVILKEKEKIEKILTNTEWKKNSAVSTNGALNLRFDLIEKILIDSGYFK
jgi:hypothetical protein